MEGRNMRNFLLLIRCKEQVFLNDKEATNFLPESFLERINWIKTKKIWCLNI